MSKSWPQVKDELESWYNGFVSHVPKPIKIKASKVFKTFNDEIMGLYKRVKGERKYEEGKSEESFYLIELETTINLIKNQTRVRSYEVTGSLNRVVSNLILDIVHPIIEMRTRVIYSFSFTIYQGWKQVTQYHKTLHTNGTFMSMSQIEEYIKQCELRRLNLDYERVWDTAYLPASWITNNPGVYEGHIEFCHICIQLVSWNEPLLGCGP